MIIGIIGLIWDAWGFQDMFNTYQELKASREIPMPDISSMLQSEILKWGLIGLISFALIFFGYFGWKKGRQTQY